jgi:hypothetical protein
MTVPDKAGICAPPPPWWKPDGDRAGLQGFGTIEGSHLRQSEEEALAWAQSRLITPSTAGLTCDDVEAISAYSDPGTYQRINWNFYRRRETQLNARLRAALSKCVIPDGLIAWRGAGFKLYRYPEQGPRIFTRGPQRAIGRIFDHRPPVSTSVGNGPVTIGQRQPVWYKLRIDPGVHGVFIPEIAIKGYQEQELLLAPGTRIRIDRATLVGDRWYVLATALAPSSPTDV